MAYIQLTDEDIALAEDTARQRAAAGEVTEAEGVKRGTYDPHEIELIGMMAEVGVCRIYGQEPYTTIHKKRTDGGADITYKGCTANIKATKYFNKPRLFVRDYDDKYDVYMLCSVDIKSGRVRIQGYATQKEVKNKEAECFGDNDKPCKIIPYNKLHAVKMG